jgi:tRNA modification GTPase
LAGEIGAALADARGRQVREGFRVALVGAPNAGKSSLLNALVGRDAAIVTATPGTTRDIIEVPLLLAGYRVLLADTAGLRRDPGEAIEAEGVRRARAWAEDADLRLWVVDGAAGAGVWREAADLVRVGDLLLLNKSDLPADADAAPARAFAAERGLESLQTAASAAGVAELRARLAERVVSAMSGVDFPATTRERHRALLQEAATHLDRALAGLAGHAELAAEDVRLAARALERLSGRIDPEAVLDRVFASFCIGK